MLITILYIIIVILIAALVGGYFYLTNIKDSLKQNVEEQKKRLSTTFEKLYKTWEHERKVERKRLDQERTRLEALKERLERAQAYVEKLKKEYEQKLETLSHEDKEKIKKALIDQIEESLEEYYAKRVREYEQKLETEKEELARQKLLEAMQSVARDVVVEYVTTRVKIPDEDFKGKIIGKDGRNIRAFEKFAGVDIIIDESPDTIGISSYDPVKREIARIALEQLFKDGRIHPGAIEEAVKKAKKHLVKVLTQAGKKLAEMAGWYNAPADLLVLLGRMKYRISAGQNLYQHTMEVIQLSEYIARQLGLDVRSVKIAALLHDVGKLLTSKVNKPHHLISADIARKYGLDEKIINIIEAHHQDRPAKYPECAVLIIADAISGARPGARKEDVEGFIERVSALEEKALEVVKDKAQSIFALKAGRELWIVVNPTETDDNKAALLAHKVAKYIEDSGVFPGEVDVIVLREVKAYAKAHKPQGRQHQRQNAKQAKQSKEAQKQKTRSKEKTLTK